MSDQDLTTHRPTHSAQAKFIPSYLGPRTLGLFGSLALMLPLHSLLSDLNFNKMPPRSENWSSVVPDEPGFVHAKDGTAPLASAVDQNSHHVVATKAKVVTTARQPARHTRATRKHRPKLRFGLHGWSGVVSTTFTLAAALAAHRYSESAWSSTLSICAAITASISASSGVPLIGQAPVRTVISKNVIPPHREAFRRTALSVYYLS